MENPYKFSKSTIHGHLFTVMYGVIPQSGDLVQHVSVMVEANDQRHRGVVDTKLSQGGDVVAQSAFAAAIEQAARLALEEAKAHGGLWLHDSPSAVALASLSEITAFDTYCNERAHKGARSLWNAHNDQ